MSLHVRSAGVAAWSAGLSHSADDVFRIVEHGGATVAVLANGYDHGFSTCWPEGSRRMLDLFRDAWTAAAGPVLERLLATFERARQQFAAEAQGLLPLAAQHPDDPPVATLLAVAVNGAKAHAAWIGGDVAIQTRSFGIVDETTPHTLPERYAKEHPEFVHEAKSLPNALVRTIGSRSDRAPPEILTFDLQAADSVLLVSKASLAGSRLPSHEAAFAAAVHASPASLANRLTRLGLVESDSPYTAAIVLRFDAIDLGPVMDQLIVTYEPDPRHGTWLRNWASEHQALPVAFDMGGALGMRRDGSVIGVDWEDRATRDELSPLMHAAAVIGAARNYKALESLGPKRPMGAQTCANCASSASGGSSAGCPLCWYLGWLPPQPPKWFFSKVGA